MQALGFLKNALRKTAYGMIGVFALLLLSVCSNPLEEKNKDTLIRTLVDGNLAAGKYLMYWNGKDDNKNTISPGNYECILQSEDYSQSLDMTAIAGTKGKPADSTGTGLGWYFDSSQIPLHYLLDRSFPEPFYANDGTNIAFEIPNDTYILLTVHVKK